MNVFKTPNKMNRPKASPQVEEVNPSTACRNPKKRHLMNGKTGLILLILIASLVLMSITFPPHTSPRTPPSESQPKTIKDHSLQTVDSRSSVIPEYGAVFDIVSTSDGGSAFLTYLQTPAIYDRYTYHQYREYTGIPGNERFALVKIDINGTVLWSVFFQDLVMFDPFHKCLDHFHLQWGPPGIGPTNLIQTSDNGFLFSSRFKTNPNDMYLIKVDNNGDLLWTKNYQIKANQRGCTIVDLIEANGGYAFILETWIDQETVTENWLVKTHNNGVVEWYKSFEETEDDRKLSTLIQTAEGGYCLLGKSDIFYDDGDEELALYSKIILIKTDKDGNLEWLRNIDRTVIPRSSVLVKQTEKEEFILSGYFINEKTLGLMKLSTYGEQVIWEKSLDIPYKYFIAYSNSLLTEDKDIILVKSNGSETHLTLLTDSGVKKWEKTYEGSFPFIDNTKDMNIVMGGVYDLTTCVMKINRTGSPIWTRIYGTNDTEIVTQVLSTMDGGVMLYGLTNSFGAGKYDFWLVKMDSYGNIEWHKTFGNKHDQVPISILESKDGGYFFAGETKTVDIESDKLFFGKINNKGDLSWNLTIDFSNETGDQRITFIKETTDEGYVIGGTSDLSPGYWADRTPNSWIFKLNKHGLIQWKKNYWTSFPPIQTHDDGFIIITGFKETGSSAGDRWINKIAKLNDSGDPQWERTMSLQNFIECKFIPTSNSYFLIFNSDYRSSEIAKLNLSGEMEWQKHLPWRWVDRIFIREINDGYLVWSISQERTICKYNFQGNIEWEEVYLSYFPSFNDSDSHLFYRNFEYYCFSTDEIQEWKNQLWENQALDMHLSSVISRWTKLSNGNIVIARENTTLRDLYLLSKTETILCTPNFIKNSSTTSVRTIVATPDGGCVVAGEKIITHDHPSRDIYLLKLSNTGLVEWIQTYAGRGNQIEGILIKENFIPTTTPGWGPVPLLVAIVVLAMWYRRKPK